MAWEAGQSKEEDSARHSATAAKMLASVIGEMEEQPV